MNQKTRRKFLSTLGATAVAVPLSQLVGTSPARAQAEQLDPSDPQATALEYTHESTNPDQNCANCQLYTGAEGEEWGGCAIFYGKVVAAKGWCKSWVPKA